MPLDYSQKNQEYFESSRQDILALVPNSTKTILDVGCGQGNFLKATKEKLENLQTWGVELEKNSFEQAKTKVDKIFLGTIEENLQNLPDNYFDCITFNDVLEHLVDPYSVLEKIKPKLSKDGFLITSIPNIFNFKILQMLIQKRDWKYENEGIMDKTHLRFFTEKSQKRMFEEAGFEVLKIQGIGKTTSFKFRIFNILTLGFFGQTAYSQYIMVCKPKF